jgi:hypothetical protein
MNTFSLVHFLFHSFLTEIDSLVGGHTRIREDDHYSEVTRTANRYSFVFSGIQLVT